jgi:hypothetical protein
MSDASRDLLSALSRYATTDLTDLAPGETTLVLQFKGNASADVPHMALECGLASCNGTPSLDRVLKRIDDLGVGGGSDVQRVNVMFGLGLGHAVRVWPIRALFKLPLDIDGATPLTSNHRASSRNLKPLLTPTRPCLLSSVSQLKIGPDAATPTSLAGPDHQVL